MGNQQHKERQQLQPQKEPPTMLDTFDNATVWRPERPSHASSLDTWKDYLDCQLDSLAMRDVLGGLVLLPGLQNRVHGGAPGASRNRLTSRTGTQTIVLNIRNFSICTVATGCACQPCHLLLSEHE